MQQKENNSRKRVVGGKYGVEVEEWRNGPSLEVPSVAVKEGGTVSLWGEGSLPSVQMLS